MLNQQLWLQGLYNFDAVSVAVSNFFGKQGTKKQTYLKEPLELHPHKQTPEEIRQQLVNELNSWKEAFDSRSKDNGNRDLLS